MAIKNTTHKIVITLIVLFIFFEFLPAEIEKTPFYINGVLYQDWMGFKATDTDFYNRLSTRLKLSLLNRPGNGWTLSFDIRNRATLGEGGTNQFIIYNSFLSYNSRKSKFYFSLGQMNLYDTAGIGELTGALGGFKISDSLSIGGYAGLNPDIYNTKWDFKYTKFGVFTKYRGSRARQFSLSYNLLRYDGNTEREYIYANSLLPVSGKFILYGSIEYDLKPGIKSEDRITHLFSNGRLNIGKIVSLNMNYSSGRGIDYHKFILEFSQDPSLRIEALERYYYSETYGLRLSITPLKGTRIYISQRYSEQKDKNIKNNSTRFGLSTANILKSGFSVYGNYSLNRGDLSESDSYRFSISRNFNKLSWSLNYSSYFNSIRISGLDEPEILHFPDRQTLTTDLFYYLNKAVAFSLEYSYSFWKGFNDHQFFMRIIYRKR